MPWSCRQQPGDALGALAAKMASLRKRGTHKLNQSKSRLSRLGARLINYALYLHILPAAWPLYIITYCVHRACLVLVVLVVAWEK